MTTLDLFPAAKPARVKPRVLMHVSDAGQTSAGDDNICRPLCVMTCQRCKTKTDWIVFQNVTEAKRGIPCPTCNPPTRAAP